MNQNTRVEYNDLISSIANNNKKWQIYLKTIDNFDVKIVFRPCLTGPEYKYVVNPGKALWEMKQCKNMADAPTQ